MTESADLRPFTPLLIGPWWPAYPTQLTAAAAQWDAQAQVKDNERNALRNLRTLIATSNRGNTANDLTSRMSQHEQRLLDVVEHCHHKRDANTAVANAITTLRSTLSSLANSGNNDIQTILSKDISGSSQLRV